MSYFEQTTFTPSAAAQDAFGRFRVSENYTIFDSKLLIDTASLFWDYTGSSAANSSVTYNQERAAAILHITGSNYMCRQTRMRFNYQPGKSQLILMTGDMTPEPGVIKRIGLFESIGGVGQPLNGIYFERSGSDLYTCIARSGSIHYRQTQSAWNIDTLTTGNQLNPSGYNHNPLMTQIYAFDFEWLGVGNIRFANVLDGKIVPLDQHSHANTENMVTFSNPNLPCRYSIQSSITTASGSMQTICSSVQTEGGFQINGIPRTLSNNIAGITVSTTLVPLITLRQKAGQNMSTIILDNINLVSIMGANQQTELRVILNPTFSVTPAFTSSLNSTIEYNIGTSGTITDGTGTSLKTLVVGTTTEQAQSSITSPLRLGASITNVSDIICLAAISSGTNATTVATLNYTEIL